MNELDIPPLLDRRPCSSANGQSDMQQSSSVDAVQEPASPTNNNAAGRQCKVPKPRLLIDPYNPDRTVVRLRDILRTTGELYDRGVPVRLAYDQQQLGMVAHVITPEALILMVHKVCRPYAMKAKRDGTHYEANACLPRSVAVMYLNSRGEWQLPPLNGIVAAPLLQDDGTIKSAVGYDAASGMWCESVPDLARLVPVRPTRDQAEAALRLIRNIFKTFCFADSETIDDGTTGVQVVDASKPPGWDESCFLAALMTAVCRPSLHLAPAVLVRASSMSGAGTGKGLLARCICIIAFGREPHAVTAGSTAEELDKRIAAELIAGGPILFLDNLNNTALKSDLLASVITERPTRMRLLGKSQMMPLNATAFVIVTGNGLSVSEDLARRFISVDLDSRTENPEARPFTGDIHAEVTTRREELLAALLTIWRWGRIATGITAGLPLGSFTRWSLWVRDPLLALGSQDPVARVNEAKMRDDRRLEIRDIFGIWWDKHQDRPVAASDLDDKVKKTIDPHGRSRQHLAPTVAKLAGARVAGFVLTSQKPTGDWSPTTYALKKTGPSP